MKICSILPALFLLFCTACGSGAGDGKKRGSTTATDTYTNPLLDVGPDPYAICHEGKYYYTQNCENRIILWETADITDLRNASSKEVWIPQDKENCYHIWAPELHRIDGKWYLYYSADNGHMDNQRIYVLENEAPSPMQGEFRMKGRIRTDRDDNWAIQPNVFQHRGKWYMTWCGRPDHKTDQILQYIYIAGMENPWTLATERVEISRPEYEWERQWISPDGNKMERPAFVEEQPQFLRSPQGDKLFLFFSASGSWTPYFCVGLLMAKANSDLLDPASWQKLPEPVLMQNRRESVYGTGSISFIDSPDGTEHYFLYQGRDIPNDAPGAADTRSPRLQRMEWDAEGMPLLPLPQRAGTPLAKPAGTPRKDEVISK